MDGECFLSGLSFLRDADGLTVAALKYFCDWHSIAPLLKCIYNKSCLVKGFVSGVAG